MGTMEITIDTEIIQQLVLGERDEAIRQLVETVLNEVLDAEMDEHLNAKRYERTDDRQGHRNGYYNRNLTMRVGPVELRKPRDREGNFETALFDRYQRSEQALVLAMMEMAVNGVSTRKVKRITDELCGKAFGKSTVSRLCESLDEKVEAWNTRSLEDSAHPFVIVDALHVKVRRGGRVRSTSALVAVAINEEGYREILGIKIANSESETSWKEFFRSLNERGLHGVDLVVSDAHTGLVKAVGQCFQGASWQRCQTHFRRNILDKTPQDYEDTVAAGLDAIFEADTPETARTAFDKLYDEMGDNAEQAMETLANGLEDAIAVLRLPEKYRRRLRTTNMLERLNSEIRRRERVIRIFPNERSAWRLLGAYLIEQHEDWMCSRRYFDMTKYEDWKQNPDRDEFVPVQAG